MFYLKPKEVTDVTFLSSSLAEDPTSAWVSGATYAIGDEVHLAATHRVYKNAVAGVSTVSPDTDKTRWVDERPTNKWAAFDGYTGTKSKGTDTISFSVKFGFFNSVLLYGLEGASVSLTCTEGEGGPTYWSNSLNLSTHSTGWYSYYFEERRRLDRAGFFNIPIRPNGVLNITITATGAVAIGMIAVGALVNIIGGANWGGTDWGAEVEPITYSYLEPEEDGTLNIVRRFSATNLSATVTMPQEWADQAVSKLQALLDIPVAWVATQVDGYVGLSTFGLGEGRMNYESYSVAKLNLNVRGIV